LVGKRQFIRVFDSPKVKTTLVKRLAINSFEEINIAVGGLSVPVASDDDLFNAWKIHR